MHSPENSYIREIDRSPGNGRMADDPETSAGSGDRDPIRKIARDAETSVQEYFQSQFPGTDARPSTEDEDRGHTGMDSGGQVDVIVYRNNKPETSIQVTTSVDRKVREEKLQQLRDKPFVRLEELNLQDTSIPKTLVFVDKAEVEAYIADRDWGKRPVLRRQILDGMENSLKFVMTQTQNPKEKAKVKELLDLVLKHRKIVTH